VVGEDGKPEGELGFLLRDRTQPIRISVIAVTADGDTFEGELSLRE
jgi:hypothetical protein